MNLNPFKKRTRKLESSIVSRRNAAVRAARTREAKNDAVKAAAKKAVSDPR